MKVGDSVLVLESNVSHMHKKGYIGVVVEFWPVPHIVPEKGHNVLVQFADGHKLWCNVTKLTPLLEELS